MICVACHKRGGSATDKCPFCGTPYEHASKEQFSPEFVANLDKECLYDFHIKNIDLDFDMDAVHRMMVAFGLEQEDDQKPPAAMPPISGAGVEESKEEAPSQSSLDSHNTEPEEADEEPQPAAMERPYFALSKKTKLALIKYGCYVLGAVLLIWFISRLLFHIGTWQPFVRSWEEGDYAKAAEIYQQQDSAGFHRKANNYMKDAMQDTLEDYRHNRISGVEAKERLDAMAILLGEDAGDTAEIYDEAAELEKSKKAYQNGMQFYEMGDYISAVESWSQVTPEDSDNYERIQALMKDQVVVTRLKEGIVNSAGETSSEIMQGLLYLQSMLPDGTDLNAAVDDVQDDASAEVGGNHGNGVAAGASGEGEDVGFSSDIVVNQDCPIYISEIRPTKPTPDGYINLIIRWQNRSGRTIDSVTFYVQPTSEFGYVLSCRKNQYSLYRAVDNGPYANGEGTPSETWMWRNVWSNSLIQAVDLLEVVIDYEDGGQDIIDTEAGLAALQAK